MTVNGVDITEIIKILITLIVTIISTVVIPYIKQRIGAEKYEQYKKMAKVAVQAAEMIYKESGMGDVKLDYCKRYLKEKGLTLNEDELRLLIESAVCELKEEL